MAKETRIRFLQDARANLDKLRTHPDNRNPLFQTNVLALTKTFLDTGVSFLMPPDGVILNDGFKGLPSELHLPFETIILLVPKGSGLKVRMMVIATEIDDEIAILTMIESSDAGWCPVDVITKLPRAAHYWKDGALKNGKGAGVILGNKLDAAQREIDAAIGVFSKNVLFELLEALSCKNVSHVKRERAKTRDSKQPHMYDEYRELVVDTSRVSAPAGFSVQGRKVREHLRRGFINTYHTKEGPVKLWIQSVIVNAGKGYNKITKAYNVRK